MNNLDNASEDEMIDMIRGCVDTINDLGSSVTTLLKHCKIQFVIGVCLYFSLDNSVWGLSTMGLWLLTFLIASFKYNDRRNTIVEYWLMIRFFKDKGVLNENNENKVKDYGFNSLPFER